MISRFVYLIPIAALAACAGGTTMRVAQDDTTDTGPVALAPEPDTSPDSGASLSPSVADSSPGSWGENTTQPGYAPYGSAPAVQVRRIGQWTHTGINERRRLVIRDANAWAAFWSELGVGDRPAVDFTRDLVVAVATGQQSTGGHEVAVD